MGEDLDHDLLGRVHAARDPYRSERDTASCGHHHVHRSDDDARHHDPSVKRTYGGTFANIFYDDVRVPAKNLIGAEGGWKVLTGALATERGFIGGGIVLKVAHMFERLCEISGRRAPGKPRGTTRSCAPDRHARGRNRGRAAVMVHCAELVDRGETPPDEAADQQGLFGELMERFGETALEICWAGGLLSEGPGRCARPHRTVLRHSLMWVISIGTNEIQPA